MARWLWHSNSPAAGTGYGQQTKLVTQRMKRHGYEVAISAFYGQEGHILVNEDGVMQLPRAGHPYGNDIIAAHRLFTRSDVVVSLIDPWVLDPKVFGTFPWAAWTPIDSAPAYGPNVESLKAARWVIAMSQFGKAELEKAGFSDVLYMPHGIDTNVFTRIDRREARAELARQCNFNIGDRFLIVTVAANKGFPPRKNFDGMMRAFAEVADELDAAWYIHAESTGMYQGVNLLNLAQHYGIQDRVFFPDQYKMVTGAYGPGFLNLAYNAGDVMLLTSMGEGFGIPIIEAQAAGCPVIVTDFSAMRELCFMGWKVGGIEQMLSPDMWQMKPDHAMTVSALWHAHNARGNDNLRDIARAGVLHYDIDRVWLNHIEPVLQRITADMEGKTDERAARTAARLAAREPQVELMEMAL